ncbi:hypothetical protein [Staphylococcus phage vB_SauM-V1SA22]|nr:hypothetical protein [Staphylococcus phage vB_SauM-V1SA22]UVT34754.1 hypothetical protein [Staphylococcus phage vB_SauM-V1SA20]BBI90190.1 hypothetical protein MRS_073 [Staphylococcus phage MR003]
MLTVDFICSVCYTVFIKLAKSLTTKLTNNYINGYSENSIRKF